MTVGQQKVGTLEMAPLYPSDSHLQVDEVFLGDLAQDSYEQAGFGVNRAGSSYLVRNFALRSADSHLIKVVEPQLVAAKATTSTVGLVK